MEEEKKNNFLEEIIEADLAAGKYDSIITRFPPEPNGYLHLGHAKSLCINFGLAQKYGGKTNLRYDDTNPTKEDVEYVDAIKEDIKWLGFQWAEERYASDYLTRPSKKYGPTAAPWRRRAPTAPGGTVPSRRISVSSVK